MTSPRSSSLISSRRRTAVTTVASLAGAALLLLVLRFCKTTIKSSGSNSSNHNSSYAEAWKSIQQWIRQQINITAKSEESSSSSRGATSTRNARSSFMAPKHNIDITDNLDHHHHHHHHIRQQQGRIQDILRYWFGQFPPAEAQKQLWMISSQSDTHRQRVDQEILQRFGHLLLRQNHSNANTAPADSSPSEPVWKNWLDETLYGIHGKVAAIILLDQFGRHVHRCCLEKASTAQCAIDDDETVSHLSNLLPLQTELDQSALAVAQAVLDQHKSDIPLLSQAMQIFTYMPFRHANRLETLHVVQAQIQVWTDLHQQHEALLSRFRKATHRRLAVLQDEARRTGTNGEGSTKQASSEHQWQDEDILEALPFVVGDMTPATKHVVYQTIQQFLVKRGITATNLSKHNNINGTSITKYPIIVSLSGGVDSMVICAILAHLASSGEAPIHVVAVHIDYANRPESAAEAAFCRDWCRNYGVDFYVRRIDEVTRGITARDAYEKISRQVRYTFYRATMEKYAAQAPPDTIIGVMLGHHRGDLRENVLSNAHKGSGPLDLSGMTAISRNDGVTLYRPLLPLEKTFIFDYAHLFGIPYFKDTTPHWSTRGKLRNRLLPLLEEIYGEGCLSNLSNLAVESDECRELLETVLFGPFMDKIQRKPMGMIISTTPWKDQGMFFWKFVLREALHSGGMGMFTDKAVASFLERVRASKEGWLQCRKDYAVFLQANGDVFVWKPESFPWHKKDQYKVEGQTVGYGRDHAVEVGPWRVTALLVPVDHRNYAINDMEEEVQARLQSKAVESMVHLMDGSLTYYVKVPTFRQPDQSLAPRPLIFRKFTRASRPLAWKNFDTKVQDTLPLLGNDDAALAALRDPIGTDAVHVNDAGETVPNPTHPVKVTVCLAGVYPPSSPAKALKKGVDVVRI
eukprot:scaffold1127_cov160-Amphora_coffeaeformis.AAC.14